MAKARSILVVVDPTTTEQPAFLRARALAGTLGLTLKLLICVHQGLPVGVQRTTNPRAARRAVLERHLAHLDSLGRASTGIEVSTKAVWDRPLHEAIIRETLRCEPAFVMKGSHYHSALSRALITHTDWLLIRDCPTPLWLVRGPAWTGPPRIAAFVDPMHEHDKPADLDRRILAQASSLAAGLRAELHAIHCHDSTTLSADFCEPCTARGARTLDNELLVEHAARLRDLAAAHDIDPGRTHLHGGPPAEAIPLASRELGVQLAVMGAVNRSRLEQAFLGSTAERVLDRLACDVLIIKPKRFESPVTYRAQAADFMELP